ncbi:transglycosylase domain-containing protein [Kurthia sibirica]|uniref:Peptidoglycan glycosyltransferase n=1 Tax=Kurthia sibirica TaxID=202750 RepID=A0A2U3AP06_9BACL|nr:transglycosylase domain-containing protein [Kurthia sibirica]PWI26283.1 peptidoglycan glycosyltransferase [Kurthia sibirica]GEK33847.1 carboxypeptidase [Kurthia sibirica]
MKYFRISSSVLWNLFLLLITLVFIGIIFLGSLGAGYFASLVKDEKLMSKQEMRDTIFNYDETSQLYFANNQYLGKMRTDLERTETTLKQVSPKLLDAVLATEDEYFYEHDGIVPKAIFRGLLQDVSNSASQSGGSTLTQQLIKNQILTNEVSYERKAKELLLAKRLEHFMTKDEILEAYLNIIPYGRNSAGRNIAGVETAAKGIFNKKASDLNLAQAAYLAGIPQSPFAYTPFTQTGQLKDKKALTLGTNRMKTVLFRMHETGYISDKQYKKTLKYDITKDFRKREKQATEKYPYVTYEIEDRAKNIMAKILAKKDGIDTKRLDKESKMKEKYMILADRELRSKGYKVYSTINKKTYDAMQKAKDSFPYYGATYNKTVTDPDTGETKTVADPVQVGSVLIENETGKIISFIGGRDFKIEELNHATQAKRSNGSTMKPLLVYAPAIQYGRIGAGSPVADVKFNYGGWSPSNYDEKEERGITSARDALKDSLNLPAIRLYAQIIANRPAEMLKKLGFSNLDADDYTNYAASIGALKYGVTVEENTNAFAAFANGGNFVDAYVIDKIVDRDGKTIFKHKSKKTRVFSEETSYIITDMLRDVLKSGTGTIAKSNLKFNADFAAKTGTSQEFKDVWVVGYNPKVTLGVWMGYDQPKTLNAYNGAYFIPSTRINMLWSRVMNSVYDADPKLATADGKTFTRPANVVNRSFCADTGASSGCGNMKSDLFNGLLSVPSVTTEDLLKPFGGTLPKAKEKKTKEAATPDRATNSTTSNSNNATNNTTSNNTNSNANDVPTKPKPTKPTSPTKPADDSTSDDSTTKPKPSNGTDNTKEDSDKPSDSGDTTTDKE